MIQIIGAGLAGSEAAYQLGKRGISVRLIDMKPDKKSPAHTLPGPAELVCSNSLGSDMPGSAGALLKAELRLADSLIIRAADQSRVPAGSALAVDREKMSRTVESLLAEIPAIEIVHEEAKIIPEGQVIIATGPLTSDALTQQIDELVGGRLSFFDATSPILETESLDMNKVFAASRWDKGDPDYLNCPMDEQQYNDLVDALLSADLVTPHDFEDSAVFEGCMPVEQIAKRGRQTLAFGPLRPVGLFEPVTGKRFFAVLQLRKENIAGDSYNLVGFQTRMTFSEQQRVFRMIPGLENAEFLRYGVMHRNTYINSPALLDGNLRLRSDPRIQFAGQITGVEGYVESCASGLMAALMAHDPKLFGPPAKSMMGALHQYVTGYKGKDFQPMAANFGLLPFPARKIRKKERKQFYHERGVEKFTEWVKENLE